MNALLQAILAISLGWLVYTYVGYPFLLWVLSHRRTVDPILSDPPTVTIITAAYDEVSVIGETIRNKLALEYPADRLQILVVSDGSEDGTDEVVSAIASEHPGRVQLLRQEPRQGKTSALNLAVGRATGEILVFSDANSIYEPQALRELVRQFADPRVGYVTGKMIYTNADGSVNGDGCTAYMRYENLLRSWETVVGSVVGVDGGIDAVRRSLYRPMNADQLPDFVLPLRVVEQGFRVAYEPRAVLREPALADSAQEYRMRVRVSLRALWALFELRQLFDPFRFPGFSWQLASHKLMRYLAFLPQVLALVANMLLVGEGPAFQLLLLGQLLFYVLAAFGWSASRGGRSFAPATAAYYLTLLNTACAHAFLRFARGEKQVLWKPRAG